MFTFKSISNSYNAMTPVEEPSCAFWLLRATTHIEVLLYTISPMGGFAMCFLTFKKQFFHSCLQLELET